MVLEIYFFTLIPKPQRSFSSFISLGTHLGEFFKIIIVCRTCFYELGNDKIEKIIIIFIIYFSIKQYKGPLWREFHINSGHVCAVDCSSSWKFFSHYSDFLKGYCPPNVRSIVTMKEMHLIRMRML